MGTVTEVDETKRYDGWEVMDCKLCEGMPWECVGNSQCDAYSRTHGGTEDYCFMYIRGYVYCRMKSQRETEIDRLLEKEIKGVVEFNRMVKGIDGKSVKRIKIHGKLTADGDYYIAKAKRHGEAWFLLDDIKKIKEVKRK